jgi:hypothetical protein
MYSVKCIFKPNEIKSLQDYNVYTNQQLNLKLFLIQISAGINTFIITGNNTDFNFLNQQQNDLSFKMSGQKRLFVCI